MNDSVNEDGGIPAHESEPNPMTAKDAAKLTNVFTRVQEILALRKQEGLPTDFSPLRVSREGGVDALSLAEMARGLEGVELDQVEAGDVVWWLTKSGARGYFAVEEPYERKGMKAAQGNFQIDREGSSSRMESQRGEGWISGAAIGGMLKTGSVLQGMPMEYSIKTKEGEPHKHIITSRVQEVGVIKGQDIRSSK